MNKKQKQLVIALFLVAAILGIWQPWKITLISVSTVNIDAQSGGYEDAQTHEWRGSFWMIEMLVDVDDQVAGFHLANDGETPESTYVEAGNLGGVQDKVYVSSYTVDGKQVMPQTDVMVHLYPKQPYYERELEIQQGYYAPETYGAYRGRTIPNYGKLGSDPIPKKSFQHYSFGTGSWTLHTPFEIAVFKNGVEIGRRLIDTVGGTQVYRIPEAGNEYIHITDLGKIGTGYGEPMWSDILYFSNNYIFRADTTSKNYVQYDAGVAPYHDANQWGGGYSVYGADSYSVYWYGYGRYQNDGSPEPYSHSGLISGNDYGGWRNSQDSLNYLRYPVVIPVFPGDKPADKQGFMSLVEWLDNKGVQRATKPSWLQKIEKTSDNKLRLYLPYGSVSSWVTLKISTELADTIVWQPQVAKFQITDYQDFGDIADSKAHSITVTCVEGAGSGLITFSKSPYNAPVGVPPAIGIPYRHTGESYKADFTLLNLGTLKDVSFSLEARAHNVLGSQTDSAVASGCLLKKTGATTLVTVQTMHENKPVSGVPITLSWGGGPDKGGTTDQLGAGVISFSLASYAGSVTASFAGNAIYLAATETVRVASGSQTTITLNLLKHAVPPPAFDWTLLLLVMSAGGVVVISVVYWKRRRR